MKEKTTKLTDLLALLVLAVFALCVLLVLLFGARVYRTMVQRSEESFTRRTATQYIVTRVQQAQSISIEDFEGCQALVIPERIDGETYLTRVYCYDGYIRELYCGVNSALSPEDGEKVIAGGSLSFSLEGVMLTALVDGRQVILRLLTGREVPG